MTNNFWKLDEITEAARLLEQWAAGQESDSVAADAWSEICERQDSDEIDGACRVIAAKLLGDDFTFEDGDEMATGADGAYVDFSVFGFPTVQTA